MAEQKLQQGVGLAAMVALGLGTAVGVGIFSITAPAASLAGAGMLVSLALAAAPMAVISINYAFMGSILPTSGASYEWPRRFIHPAFAFLVGWLRIPGTVGGMLILSLVLVRYLSMVAALPTKLTMLLAFVIVFGTNYFGIRIAAGVQVLLMTALVIFLLVFVALGLPHASAHNFVPLLQKGWGGVLAAIPLLVGLFFGIESSTELGDEAKDGRKSIPWGIGISIGSAVILYGLVASVSLGVLGSSALAASNTPLLDVAAVFMGTLANPLIVTAAAVAGGKSLNAVTLVFSRYLFAMGRSGVLPSALARIHPRFSTPHVALMTAFAACVVGLLLPLNLITLFLALNIPTLLKYASSSLCAARVARRDPGLFASSGMQMRPVTMSICGYTGAALAIAMVLLGLTADWRPYAGLAAWAGIGMAYYLLRSRRKTDSDSPTDGALLKGADCTISDR